MYRFHDAQPCIVFMMHSPVLFECGSGASPSYGEVVLKLFPLAHNLDC